MALAKSYELDNGVVANYWRIEELAIDRSVKPVHAECTCKVSLFLSAEAKAAGKDSAYFIQLDWNGEENPFNNLDTLTANPVMIAYAKLKTLPLFEDALDC